MTEAGALPAGGSQRAKPSEDGASASALTFFDHPLESA